MEHFFHLFGVCSDAPLHYDLVDFIFTTQNIGLRSTINLVAFYLKTKLGLC